VTRRGSGLVGWMGEGRPEELVRRAHQVSTPLG
jgi:hypothetical protein